MPLEPLLPPLLGALMTLTAIHGPPIKLGADSESMTALGFTRHPGPPLPGKTRWVVPAPRERSRPGTPPPPQKSALWDLYMVYATCHLLIVDSAGSSTSLAKRFVNQVMIPNCWLLCPTNLQVVQAGRASWKEFRPGSR